MENNRTTRGKPKKTKKEFWGNPAWEHVRVATFAPERLGFGALGRKASAMKHEGAEAGFYEKMVVFPKKWDQHPHQTEFLNIRWFGRRLSHFSFKSGFAQKRIPKISQKFGSLSVRGFGHDLSAKNLKIAWNDFLFCFARGWNSKIAFPLFRERGKLLSPKLPKSFRKICPWIVGHIKF